MTEQKDQTEAACVASELTQMLGSIFYVPEDNRKNPTQCCGKWGTPDEWQCMWLAHDDVFGKGVCEWGNGRVAVHDVYDRPKNCPLRTP